MLKSASAANELHLNQRPEGVTHFVAQVILHARQQLGLALPQISCDIGTSQGAIGTQGPAGVPGAAHFPVESSDDEAGHSRQVRWHHRANWILELLSSGRRGGQPFRHVQQLLTTLKTGPKALLRLVRQRWTREGEWPWVRDRRLGEDAHHSSEGNGVQVLALRHTLALDLLRRCQ